MKQASLRFAVSLIFNLPCLALVRAWCKALVRGSHAALLVLTNPVSYVPHAIN